MRIGTIALSVLLALVLSACQSGWTSSYVGTPVAAPSYSKIQAGLHRLTANTPIAVNDDGLVDKDLESRLTAYSDSLKGERIEGWQGWYVTHDGQSEEADNIYALMHAPTGAENERYTRDVTLTVITPNDELRNQIASLQFGQQVTFSGYILGVDPYGVVYVDEASIK